jgi:hypothetical protein
MTSRGLVEETVELVEGFVKEDIRHIHMALVVYADCVK